MTMLDDNRLAELFGRAAEAFEVPESGMAEIVARAERGLPEAGAGADTPGLGAAADGAGGAESPDELGRRRHLVAVARRHRFLSVAAILVVALIVTGTIGAVTRPSSSPTTSALQTANEKGASAGGTAHGLATTTTLPGSARAAGGPAPAPSGATTPAAAAPNSVNGSSAGTSAPNQSVPPLPQGAIGQPAKIEQTGTLDVTVKKGGVLRAMTGLTDLAGSVGGFVASSQSQNGTGGGAAYGTITMEVPVDNFATVMREAARYGKTSNVSTSATDVTSQYVDLQARLSALEDSRQQYLTILAKATTIGDILSVQEQLDSIQQQIEQIQGQLNVLTSETSYSKVTVTVSEVTPPPHPVPLPESGLVQAWHDSVGGFVTGVEGVVRLAGPFLFGLLCLALVVVGGRVLWRRYQRHRL
jgi:hypothetical protein